MVFTGDSGLIANGLTKREAIKLYHKEAKASHACIYDFDDDGTDDLEWFDVYIVKEIAHAGVRESRKGFLQWFETKMRWRR
jgi:hypothetical protein